MRDFTANERSTHFIAGGTSANYLVRSTATNNALKLGDKVRQPASKGHLKRLESLTQKELLQNIEVQQSLRRTMEKIQTESLLLQDPDNTIKFATDKEKERCHKAVSKIRRDVFRTGPLVSDGVEKHAVKCCSSFVQGGSFDRMEDGYPERTTHSRKRITFITPEATTRNGTCIGKFTAEKSQCLLPAISPHIKVNSPVQEDQNTPLRHSLPLLDANSRFGIIRRTSELRGIRLGKTTKQKPANDGHCKGNGVFPGSPRIEIFANNFKLLNSRETKGEERPSNKLKFLDSASFNETDCDDFLHVKNRLDNLSPMPAVIDHRKYWPRTKKSTKEH